MITYWRSVWCCLAFERFAVYNHRGDADPAFVVDLGHVEVVEVVQDMEDGDMFSVHVAGGLSHFFKLADVGHPIKNLHFAMWVRRLRRAAPRIPTNELVGRRLVFGGRFTGALGTCRRRRRTPSTSATSSPSDRRRRRRAGPAPRRRASSFFSFSRRARRSSTWGDRTERTERSSMSADSPAPCGEDLGVFGAELIKHAPMLHIGRARGT